MVNSQGDEIFVYTEGDQSPQVLLVPGWESSAYRFSEIIDRFREESISFMFFDLPAQGKSQGTHNNAIKTSKIIEELLKQTPSISTVLGHSFGGGSAFLALSRMEEDDQHAVDTLITVSSPTSYRSVFNRFTNYLGVPQRIEEPLLDRISEYIDYDFRDYDFRDYDWVKIGKLESVDINVYHDLDDGTIPVRDAIKVDHMFPVTITEGLGHSGIMQDPTVINQLMEIIRQKVNTIQTS